jgi:threonine synthase
VASAWIEVCRRCGDLAAIGARRWRCGCGGLLDLHGPAGADPVPRPADGPAAPWSLWRYRAVLPTAGDSSFWQRVTLGEGLTPLIPVRPGLWLKLDHVAPTGSFKDRGASVMMAMAGGLGVDRVVADSSGNAGLSVAAYAARAGIAAVVYVPASTGEAKTAAIEAHGARVVRVDGDRAATAAAARTAVETGGAWYASHVYQPSFAHGVKTLAFELWEQLGGHVPATLVVPAGNGTLVMGAWLGFRELARAGRADRMPHLVAVQAEHCAPLAGLPPSGPTRAAGIAIAEPPRGGEVRGAVMASRSQVVTVGEGQLDAAQASLALRGVGVEPSAAAAWAGLDALGSVGARDAGATVVVLTGR